MFYFIGAFGWRWQKKRIAPEQVELINATYIWLYARSVDVFLVYIRGRLVYLFQASWTDGKMIRLFLVICHYFEKSFYGMH